MAGMDDTESESGRILTWLSEREFVVIDKTF
jgi:hypothetical protein